MSAARLTLKNSALRLNSRLQCLNDEYVESRVHIRGRGKAYQIEIRNDGNKDLRLAGINTLVRTQ